MTEPAATLLDVLDGFRGLIVAAGIAEWSDTDEYADGVVGIVYNRMPQSPSQVVSLTAQALQHDAKVDESLVAVRIRMRAADDDVAPLLQRSAAIFDVLQGLERIAMGAMHVALVWQQNGGSIGQDKNNRQEWVDTYYARVNWPTTNRTL